ncbi:uncharacterized protein NEMAJ01_1174 [Nematocida major]|uniref:uncharacterized protein n=1 Tax=Nematocida major TaxID=1912982 RepID=UPI0020072494|nr:uncharacterized protein NEMAJ01_1174 [Nematocida major]KAH9386278.1 hypothetical protein NEMAJ01_1174 [Nematocida major]
MQAQNTVRKCWKWKALQSAGLIVAMVCAIGVCLLFYRIKLRESAGPIEHPVLKEISSLLGAAQKHVSCLREEHAHISGLLEAAQIKISVFDASLKKAAKSKAMESMRLMKNIRPRYYCRWPSTRALRMFRR